MLFYSAALHIALSVVSLVKTAYYHSARCAGVYKTIVFQIDAHMIGGALVSSVVKENQVALVEFAFAYLLAIACALLF